MKTKPQAVTLNRLETLPGYRRHFMDLSLWQPYIIEVCGYHDRNPSTIHPGLAGTYPTFLIDDCWVIKFFGRQFDGLACFEVERQIGKLLQGSTQIPIPSILHAGKLKSASHPWRYLIFELIHGESIGIVYDLISIENKLKIARDLGFVLHQLHQLKLNGMDTDRFPKTSHELQMLLQSWVIKRQKRHETGLPPHLADQLSGYLEHNVIIFPMTKPHLIHADVTRDHIFGDFDQDRWEIHALIDFGDVMHANIYYELIALHLDVFNCDKRLLRAFLDAYSILEEDKHHFPEKCMLTALQHQFDVFSFVFERHPSLSQITTLEELAMVLWNLDTPGVSD